MSSSRNVQYIDEHKEPSPGRKLGDVLYQTVEQVLKLVETRFAMLQSEMKEKIAEMKASAPMLVMGGFVAATSFLVLTGALIALLAQVFAGSPWAVCISCAIVGALYAIIGAIMLSAGLRSIRGKGLVPERTIQVLKDDRAWLESEAKTHL